MRHCFDRGRRAGNPCAGAIAEHRAAGSDAMDERQCGEAMNRRVGSRDVCAIDIGDDAAAL